MPNPFDLTEIVLYSGMNTEGKPFCHMACGHGPAGQLTPEEMRAHGRRAFEVAEAAEHDAITFSWLTEQMGLDRTAAAHAIADLRKFRPNDTASKLVLPPDATR